MALLSFRASGCDASPGLFRNKSGVANQLAGDLGALPIRVLRGQVQSSSQNAAMPEFAQFALSFKDIGAVLTWFAGEWLAI